MVELGFLLWTFSLYLRDIILTFIVNTSSWVDGIGEATGMWLFLVSCTFRNLGWHKIKNYICLLIWGDKLLPVIGYYQFLRWTDGSDGLPQGRNSGMFHNFQMSHYTEELLFIDLFLVVTRVDGKYNERVSFNLKIWQFPWSTLATTLFC